MSQHHSPTNRPQVEPIYVWAGVENVSQLLWLLHTDLTEAEGVAE